MKLEIQLYISGQRVDLFEDESISLTQTIQDIKDVSKVFTDYSQSFTLPASSENNKIFKHYYNPDITNGFDARVKVDATIELNYQKFRSGKIKLEGVQLKDNKPYAYKVTFFGSTITLKDLLGEDLLSDIDFSDYDASYSANDAATYLQSGITVNSITDAIICPLISAEQRWWYDSSDVSPANLGNIYPSGSLQRGIYYKNLKYAIRIPAIIREIEQTYGLTFSTDFFTSSQTDYYNLYMWLHREKGQVTVPLQSEYLDQMPYKTFLSTYGFGTAGNQFVITDATGGVSYDITFNVICGSDGIYNVVLYKDGAEYERHQNLTGNSTPTYNTLTNGTYKIAVEYETEKVIDASTNMIVTRGALNDTFTFTGSQTLNQTYLFQVSENMPKMKVIDFLTGLFKMFNLTAYEEDGTIVVLPLDDYYAAGTSYDITEYIYMDEVDVSPSALYNVLNFRYKGLDTFFAKNHLETFNLEWATEQYALDNKYEGQEYSVEIPFEHMKMERLYDDSNGVATGVMWGWYVEELQDDNVDGVPYIANPLLFYAIKKTSSTQIRIYDGENATYDNVQYYIPSNSVSLTSSQNLNFKAEINEYATTVFTDTLFQTYYSTYISDVFDTRNRIFKYKALLPLKILTRYELNDTLVIANRSYKINKIDTNLTTGESSLELIPNL